MCHLSNVIITDCIIIIIIITIMMKRWGLRVIWCLIDASRTHNLGTGKNHPCTYSSSSFPLHCHHHFIMNIVIIISTSIRTCNLEQVKTTLVLTLHHDSKWFQKGLVPTIEPGGLQIHYIGNGSWCPLSRKAFGLMNVTFRGLPDSSQNLRQAGLSVVILSPLEHSLTNRLYGLMCQFIMSKSSKLVFEPLHFQFFSKVNSPLFLIWPS